jgi:hypothetical protein
VISLASAAPRDEETVSQAVSSLTVHLVVPALEFVTVTVWLGGFGPFSAAENDTVVGVMVSEGARLFPGSASRSGAIMATNVMPISSTIDQRSAGPSLRSA